MNKKLNPKQKNRDTTLKDCCGHKLYENDLVEMYGTKWMITWFDGCWTYKTIKGENYSEVDKIPHFILARNKIRKL